jgi:hypothetical protein
MSVLNPILFNTAEGIYRLAVAIDAELRLSLADRASMRRTGAVLDLGSVNGTNTDTTREVFSGLDGYDGFQATAAEDTDVAATGLTVTTADIAVARSSMRRDVGDLYVLTGERGRVIDPSRLAASMVGEWDNYYTRLVCDTIDGFATGVGTLGAGATVDDFMDGIFQLEDNAVPGPYYFLGHNHQWSNVQNSLRGETGPLQWVAAVQDQIAIKGPGYKGMLLGVEIYTSNKVNSSGGNRYGGMWGLGAIGSKRGTMEPSPGATIVRPDAEIVVEFQRDGSRAITEVIGHGYLGMGILEDLRGTVFHTSAS